MWKNLATLCTQLSAHLFPHAFTHWRSMRTRWRRDVLKSHSCTWESQDCSLVQEKYHLQFFFVSPTYGPSRHSRKPENLGDVCSGVGSQSEALLQGGRRQAMYTLFVLKPTTNWGGSEEQPPSSVGGRGMLQRPQIMYFIHLIRIL